MRIKKYLLCAILFMIIPASTSAQDLDQVLAALRNFEKNIQSLIDGEAKTRKSEITKLQLQIDQLIAKKTNGDEKTPDDHAVFLEQISSIQQSLNGVNAELSSRIEVLQKEYQGIDQSEDIMQYRQLSMELAAIVTDLRSSLEKTVEEQSGQQSSAPQSPFDNLKISGQVRFREELNDRSMKPGFDANELGLFRSRLGLTFKPQENVTVFLQFQDSRTFGVEGGNTLSNGSNIDLHQGYFEIRNAFTIPGMTLRLGRQEIVYGGQRLVGSVGWSNVARSFDAVRFLLKKEWGSFDAWGAKLIELQTGDESQDKFVLGLDLGFRGNKFFKPRGFIISETDKSLDGGGNKNLSRFTAGTHVLGSVEGFSYDAELVYQFGEQRNVDINAYLAALSAGYLFPGKSKFKVSIGYDHLSGNDGSDKVKVFNTLYATNHKFYGFLDYFLNIPVHTNGLGLRDYMVKGKFTITDKLSGGVDFHVFRYTEKDAEGEVDLGKEIDVTANYSLSNPVKINIGLLFFTPDEVFKRLKGDKNGFKAYTMFTVNF